MTTIVATALRHAVREVLAPFAAYQPGTEFSTIAQGRVFVDRNAFADDLGDTGEAQPTISIYTPQRDGVERGRSQGSASADWMIDLHILLTMAVIDDEAGESSVMAAASTPEAEANLDYLGLQIRQLLLVSEAGLLFRRLAKKVPKIQARSFFMPEYQLAIAQHELIVTCECDDALRDDAGGLPERVDQVRLALPAGSDGRRYLDQFAAAIDPITRVPLNEIRLGANVGKPSPETFDDAELQGRVDTTET